MSNHNDDQLGASAARLSKRARFQALLFAGAAFGTALLTLGAPEVKLPPFKAE